MTTSRHDVLALGHAIVDVIAAAEDDFLVREELAKGSMRLIDDARADRLYAAMGPAREMSGGSAANTAAAIAALGGRAAYIGKVGDDHLGRIFAHDIRAADVSFSTPPLDTGVPTGRCLILVTPDGERTMNTYLGAAQSLSPEDIGEEDVAASAILYLEGYLWDPPAAKAAFRRAAAIARQAGRLVALSLSDSFCVERWRGEFLDLIRGGAVDLVFANESEIRALYETADLDTAIAALRGDARLAAVTRGEQGAVVVTREETIAVRAMPVERVVDTTGAGDLFAAGFLHGLSQGRPLETCARLGSIAAAEIVSHFGARPERSLKDLVAQSGLGA